jgi:autotransporter-associated beta strand protein/probable HAF family extracellular repeat protein
MNHTTNDASAEIFRVSRNSTTTHPAKMKRPGNAPIKPKPWFREIRFLFPLLAVSTLLATGPAQAQVASSYLFTDLGFLGGPTITVTGINDSGVIVGTADTTQIDPTTTDNISNAFRTTATQGSLTNLGALPGGLSSEATGINNAGTIIGISDTKNSNDFPVQHAFSIIGSTSTSSLSSANDLGTLPSGTDLFSSAYAINTAGTIVGTSTVTVPNSNGGTDYQADAYSVPTGTTLSGATDLGRFNGKALAPFALNDSGVIVGAAGIASIDADGNEVDNPQAVIIDSNGARLLGNLGGSQSFAYGINNSGKIAGYSYTTGNAAIHAFSVDGSGMHDLGTLGGTNSYARQINNAGVIVGASELSDGSTHAFVDFGAVMIDLNTLISSSTPLGSFTLGGASAINNLGQIAGTSLINGVQHAFLLTPIFDGVYWTGSTSANWNDDKNWNTGASNQLPGAAPTATTDVYFSTTTPTPGHLVNSTVNAPISIHSLTFLNGAALTVVGNGGVAANTLTIGSGGVNVQSTSANYGITANVILGATQSWIIGASSGPSTSDLIVSGTLGDAGNVAGLIKLGSGTLTISGATSYTGGTNVLGGTLAFSNSGSASGAYVNGGGAVSGGLGGITEFNDSASVGTSTFINNAGSVSGAFGGSTQLKDASAAHGTFTNNGADVAGANSGTTKFFGTANAADGTFTNRGGTVAGALGGLTQFNDSSSADNGQFTNESGTGSGALSGSTQFVDSAKASTTKTSASTFTNKGSATSGALGGSTKFNNDASASTGNFINQESTVAGPLVSGASNGITQVVSGYTLFTGNSDAGSGTFSNNLSSTASGAVGGVTIFLGNSDAYNGTFTNAGGTMSGGGGGATLFHDASRASFFSTASTFTNAAGTVSGAFGGTTTFSETASGGPGTATFNNTGSAIAGALGGSTQFGDEASAGSGVFNNNSSSVIGLLATGANGATTQVVSGYALFTGNADAGSGTFNNNETGTTTGSIGGVTIFLNSSDAHNGTFANAGGTVSGGSSGATIFRDSSVASVDGSSSIFKNIGGTVSGAAGGSTVFTDSTAVGAGHATFNNEPGTASGALGGTTKFSASTSANGGSFYSDGSKTKGASGGITEFHDSATADQATFTNNGGVGGLVQPLSDYQGGKTQFYDASTAGSGTFTNNAGTGNSALGGSTEFYNQSTAGSARLVAQGTGSSLKNPHSQGGSIYFYNSSDGGTATVELHGNGFLDISQHALGSVSIGSMEGNGDVFLGAKVLTVGGNNENSEFSGTIDDVAGPTGSTGTGSISAFGGLTKIGTGTLTLSGSNEYSGTTVLKQGVLNVGSRNALNTTDPNTTSSIQYGGEIRFAGGTLQFSAKNQEDYSSRIKDSNAAIALDTNGQNVTFDNVLDATNTGGLIKSGAGRLTLGGANAYGGLTIVTGGSLAIGADNNLGSGGVLLSNGSTIQFTSSFTLTHQITISGDPTFNVGKKLKVGIATTIADGDTPGELVKIGTGTLNLSAANTYTGPTTVTTGVLQAGIATNAFGTGSAVTVGKSGTLDLTGFDNTVGSLAGRGKVLLGSHTLTTGSDGTSTAFAGTLSDTSSGGGLVKTGSGTLTLGGKSSYSGTTTVSSGQLLVNGALAAASAVRVSSGASLGGSGKIGAFTIQAGGTLGDGSAPGVFTATTATFTGSGSTYEAALSKGTANTGAKTLHGERYDQTVLAGSSKTAETALSLDSNSSVLRLNLSGELQAGTYDPNGTNRKLDNFFLFKVANAKDTILGQFAYATLDGTTLFAIDYSAKNLFGGLNGIGTFTLGGQEFAISEHGNSANNSTSGGNDLVLTVITPNIDQISPPVAAPEPGAISLLLGGFMLLLRKRKICG